MLLVFDKGKKAFYYARYATFFLLYLFIGKNPPKLPTKNLLQSHDFQKNQAVKKFSKLRRLVETSFWSYKGFKCIL